MTQLTLQLTCILWAGQSVESFRQDFFSNELYATYCIQDRVSEGLQYIILRHVPGLPGFPGATRWQLRACIHMRSEQVGATRKSTRD